MKKKPLIGIVARDLANALIILCRRAETMRESDTREPISKGSLALISGSLICAK